MPHPTDRSLRTLFIVTGTLYPPTSGRALRNWQNICLLQEYGPVSVLSISDKEMPAAELPGIDRWLHFCRPDFQLSTGEQWQRRAWPLRPDGHPETDSLYATSVDRALQDFLTSFRPDLAIVEQMWLYRYLATLKRSGCKVILDKHNVEFSLHRQIFGVTKLQLPRVRSLERRCMAAVDRVWVCSDADARLLQELYRPRTPLHVVPNGIDTDRYAAAYRSECPLPPDLEPRPRDIMFLGLYQYPPNAEAADLLIREIYPRLQCDYPDSRLLLVGHGPTAAMVAAAAANPNIIVTGSVPEVVPYLAAASVMVAPLFKGSGTRLKIVEAFAAGCPVVTTPLGCEGMPVRHGEHLLMAETVDAIVADIGRLWSTAELSRSLTAAAYRLVQSEYSRAGVAARVAAALQGLSLPLEAGTAAASRR